VTRKAAVALHKTLRAHVLETCLLHKGKGRLSELGCGEETGWRAVGVRGGIIADLLKDLLRFDAAISVDRLEGHRHIVLSDSLATRTTKVDGKLLGVVLDDLSNREAVVLHEMTIGTIPNFLGDGAAGIEFHTHTLFLRTLSSEDIGRDRLLNLSFTEEDLLFSLLVAGLELDDLATSNHTNVLKLDLNVIVGEDHTDEGGVEASNTTNIVLSRPCLHQASNSCTRVHSMGDCARETSIASKHTGDVDRIVVTRNTSISLVGCRSLEDERSLAIKRDGILEVDGLFDRRTNSLKVVNNGIAMGCTSFVVDGSDLDDFFCGKLQQNLTLSLHIAVNSLILETIQALKAESQGLVEELNLGLIDTEPFLRSEDSHILG